jgi:hypothetical protein
MQAAANGKRLNQRHRQCRSPPAELPMMQSVKFYLAVNLKAAIALELTIPATRLALADGVIE